MTHLTALVRTLGTASCVALLAACTSAPGAAPAPKLQAMLSQAAQAAGSGEKEKAVTMWQQAAASYPADKAPRINIAQTRFDAGQYVEAIVSAGEVRDPSDKSASSIVAISGMRLSTRAIADLRRQNKLSGTLRTESQDLTRLLRESLGDTNLAPPGATRVPSRPKQGPMAGNPGPKSDPCALR